MRIGIDCRLWDETGVGRYTRNLVEQLKILDQKNDYTLFVLKKDEDEILKQVQNDNFRIVKADIRWHSLEEQLEFHKILNKENCDLIHFPYFSLPIFYNRPYVVTIHDLILHHFPTGRASTLPYLAYILKLFTYKFLLLRIAKKAKKIIAVSNATKKEIIDHLNVGSEKIVVTYEGVDQKISNLKSQISNKLLITNYKLQNKYFLYVGNAYPHKNLERLLEAFYSFCHPELVSGSQLSQDSDLRQNNTKLVLVGKEDYFYKRLKDKVNKIGLKDSVIFFGQATDEQLISLYKNAIALVLPSLMEGFGLPAIEAMANKCLVLASEIPSLQEVCGDAVIYFDPYNSSDIENKMEIVLLNGSDSFEDKIKKGLERAKKFSWERMAKETLKIYESGISLRSS